MGALLRIMTTDKLCVIFGEQNDQITEEIAKMLCNPDQTSLHQTYKNR